MLHNESDIGEKNTQFLIQAIADRLAGAILVQQQIDDSQSEAVIRLSTYINNALERKSDGYYVEKFKISEQPNNALKRFVDGYFVQQFPSDVLVQNDYDQIMARLSRGDTILQAQIDVLTDAIRQVLLDETKHKTHIFEGSALDEEVLVFDLTTQYNLTSNIIMHNEVLIHNPDPYIPLSVRFTEYDIQTMDIILKPRESQKYVLSNIADMKLFMKGIYNVHFDITYA